jgi:uncharacterized membrane protein YjjP (DUF1212 family)
VPLPLIDIYDATPTNGSSAESLLIRMAKALHVYGTPAHQLEEEMLELAGVLEIQVQFFSTPTAMFASFGNAEEHRTTLVRVEPGDIDLSKLRRVSDLRREVMRGDRSIESAVGELDVISASAPSVPRMVTAIAFAVATGSAAAFFGGGVREIGAAAIVGFGIALIERLVGRFPNTTTIFQPLAAFVASFVASVGSWAIDGLAVEIVVLSGLIVLVPGLSLTIALNELVTRHLSSGTTRLMGAATQMLAIGFGVAVGAKLASLIPGVPTVESPIEPDLSVFALAVVVAPISFAILFRAPPRDYGWILVASLAALGGARAGAAVLGPELGAFVGSLVLGLVGNGYARWLDRSPMGLVVPGLLMLVPGSLGFRSFVALMDDHVLRGVDAAFAMAVVATALVAGILIANVILPPRRRHARNSS